jgi:AAA15 family ATPase/GTPase
MILESVKIVWTLTGPIEFSFNKDVTPITGPNGYGKTILLNTIYSIITSNEIPEDYKNLIEYFKLVTSDGVAEYFNGELHSSIPATRIYYIDTFREKYSIPTDVEYPADFIDLVNGWDSVFQYFWENSELKCRVTPTRDLLTFDQFSSGIKNLMLLGSAIDRIRNGGILLVDDIERSMHLAVIHELKERIFGLVKNGQIIYTTHSASLIPFWEDSRDLFELEQENLKKDR